jgi:chromate reductase
VLRPQSVIGGVFQKMTDGKFTDETSLKFLVAGVDDLLRDIAKTQSVIKQES